MIIFQQLHQFLNPSHYNDTQLAKDRRHYSGDLPRGSKVAIYLIFPNKGILASHAAALAELVRAGYAPLLVSNLPLTALMLEQLQPLCWQIMVRPNFGYDFGGYRDAILWLSSQFSDLERLILMNDSVWFPMPGAMDWIAKAEALQCDLAGAICTGFSGRSRASKFRTTAWQVDMNRPGVHYGSFALMFSASLLQSQSFLTFWRKLRLSQGKNRTIKRGEIGLTQWVIRHGFSHGATSDVTRFDQVLAAMPEMHLDQTFENLIIVQDDKAVRERLKLAEKSLTRAEKEGFIRMVVARRGPSLSLPGMMIKDFGYAFLKKYASKLGLPEGEKMSNVINEVPEPMRSLIFTETGLIPPQ